MTGGRTGDEESPLLSKVPQQNKHFTIMLNIPWYVTNAEQTAKFSDENSMRKL